MCDIITYISEEIYVTIKMLASSKRRSNTMKHVKTLNNKTLQTTMKKGGCGECQTSCQSACKTSCTVGNQTCERERG